VGDDENRLLPKIVEQKALQARAVTQRLVTLGAPVPAQRKVAVDDADAVVNGLVLF
jgi:hypothetical protein